MHLDYWLHDHGQNAWPWSRAIDQTGMKIDSICVTSLQWQHFVAVAWWRHQTMIMRSFHLARPNIRCPRRFPNLPIRTLRWQGVVPKSTQHHRMQLSVLFPFVRFFRPSAMWCLRKRNATWICGHDIRTVDRKCLPSRIALSKSFRVSSCTEDGRIFFACVNFAGVMSLPPALPLFKLPFNIGLYVSDGLWSFNGGGGGGGGGATDFGEDCCFGECCRNERESSIWINQTTIYKIPAFLPVLELVAVAVDRWVHSFAVPFANSDCLNYLFDYSIGPWPAHWGRPVRLCSHSFAAIQIAMYCDFGPIFSLRPMNFRLWFDASDVPTSAETFARAELAAAAAMRPGQRICFDYVSVCSHSIPLACCRCWAAPVAVGSAEFWCATANISFRSIAALDQRQRRTNFEHCTCHRRTLAAGAVNAVAAADGGGPMRTETAGAPAMWTRNHRHPLTDSFVAAQSNSDDFGIGRSCMRHHRRRWRNLACDKSHCLA